MRDEEFIELFDLYRIINKRWNQEWSKFSENGHSVTHTMVLEILETEGRQMASSLASALSITTGGITGIVDKLESERLVSKTRDNRDRRVVYMEITEKGSDLLKVLLVQRLQFMKSFFFSLSEQELYALLKINQKLSINTQSD